jgi:hypothetical protein
MPHEAIARSESVLKFLFPVGLVTAAITAETKGQVEPRVTIGPASVSLYLLIVIGVFGSKHG